ncbi:MAG: hypothetical protein OEV00_11035 [Acidobacteriota bacterium]|nr:hypothetical protein [Acidobacteriota bacterium]MDH3785848.1 hypothetical protein [Acidobacteriota bacterium]
MTHSPLAWLAGIDDQLRHGVRLDGPDRERFQDLVRDASLRSAFEALREDDQPGRRSTLRALLIAAIRDGCEEPFLVRERSIVETAAPKLDVESCMLLPAASEARTRGLRDWSRLYRDLEPIIHDRFQWIDQRCRDWGLAGRQAAFAHVEGPADALPLEHYEREMLEPLDDRVQACLRDRQNLRWPGHLVERLPSSAIDRGVDRWHGFGPAAGPSRFGGPTGLRDSLGSIGVARRDRFVREEVGVAEARWGDPAFRQGARTLHARLAINPDWLAEYGIRVDRSLADGLLMGELLAPRIAWAYVSGERDEAWKRATGEDATIADRMTMDGIESPGLSLLRGMAYGLLLEERLLSRFGWGWYRSPAGIRWLKEIWDGERGQSAERMAADAGIGTIDGTPILDRSLQSLDIEVRRRMETS